MGERVEFIPDDDSLDDGLLQEPNGPGACPTFFMAQCHEARKGGASAYEQAGYTLIGAIGGLCPDWLDDEDQWVAAACTERYSPRSSAALIAGKSRANRAR